MGTPRKVEEILMKNRKINILDDATISLCWVYAYAYGRTSINFPAKGTAKRHLLKEGPQHFSPRQVGVLRIEFKTRSTKRVLPIKNPILESPIYLGFCGV